MRFLLMIICVVFLSISVMAQSDDNTIKKVNDPNPVELTIKKVNSPLVNTQLGTIKPVTKIANSELKLHPGKAIDNEKLKLKSKAIQKE